MQKKIERTFIISLPERLITRLIPLIDYIKSIGLDYSVHSATKDDDGRRGLILSVQELLYKCVEENLECILVLEDDCKFLRENTIEVIDKCLLQLPEDYDMLFLGCYLTQKLVHKYSENLLQLSEARATQSIIYSRQGMLKLLKALENPRGSRTVVPLDDVIQQKIMREKKTFCSFPNLTSQHSGFSDIEKRHVHYHKWLEETYNRKTAHL